MAIQVTQVSPPAPGVDWAFTVPGQWLPYLYGVTATLGTNQPVVTIPDASGNGHDANVTGDNVWQLGVTGPYAGGSNNYCCFHPADPNVGTSFFARAPASLAFGPVTLTVDGWWQALTAANLTQNGDFWGFVSLPSSQVGTLFSQQNTNDPLNLGIVTAGVGQQVLANFMSRAVWHHVATTWDGANWNFYRDGVLIGSSALRPWLGGGSSNEFRFPGDSGIGIWRGYAAGIGVYAGVLSGAQISAHAAAVASPATYRAAVLADAPVAFYELNTIPTLANRMATLQVTDGTNVVAQFPANFAAATASGFIWSWQALGSGAAASTDGVTNSVAIPEIRVDSGYTIGVKTLDLQPTDQWGPITVWFDDGTGPGGTGPGGTSGVDYLDARFVPDVPNG